LLVMPGRRSLDVTPAPPPSAEPSSPPAPAPSTERPPPASSAPAPPAAPSYVRVDPEGATACEPGMILVDGVYCPYVGHRCARFEDEAHDVCATYALEAICEGGLLRRRFCVDVYEYPNIAGVRPAVWASFDDAKRACAVEGKRLCAAEEWEL